MEIAREFTEAWTRRDLDKAGSFLADGVVFDGPMGHVEGKGSYLESLSGLAKSLELSGVRVLAAFGDEKQALIMYELLSGKVGPLRCAKLFDVHDGKITSDTLAFDSFQIRKTAK